MTEESTTRVTYTVSELNEMIRGLLEDSFPPLWITGEISNYLAHSSGHWYFSLKDSGAQVRCAMFQGRNRASGLKVSNGMQVLLRGKISLYTVRGEFQLVVDYMEEAGDGALRRAYEELKKRLHAEGLFDPARKKPLPLLPKTIGVITSPTGAAIRDILSVLRRRFPNINVIIYPAAVQGASAAPQLVRALQLANQRKECEVLILARGGGSLEDLWSFNEESVARAIHASDIPLVSAVGHEIDFTIADFVADHRAATPSAAAELVSPDQADWQLRLDKLYNHLVRQMLHILMQQQNLLTNLSKRLRHPGQRIREQMQRLDELDTRLRSAIANALQRKTEQLQELNRALRAISPFATLARGYAIVTLPRTGEILRDASGVSVGDKIHTRLEHGELESTVD